jgi:hypothetical protein
MKVALSLLAALVFLSPLAFCQDARQGTGLETGGDTGVRVVVGDLSDDARLIGLDKDALQLRCEQMLVQYGLTPMDEQTWSRQPYAFELRIDLRVQGLSYECTLEFRRPVRYTGRGAEYTMVVPTWRTALADGRIQQLSYVAKEFPPWRGRSHEPGARLGHSSYVRDAVIGLVEAFCRAFLESNPK